MMASLVSCGRRLWVRAARVFVAVVVAVGVCVVCVHAAFADHPVPIPYDAHIDARDMLRYSDLAPATRAAGIRLGAAIVDTYRTINNK